MHHDRIFSGMRPTGTLHLGHYHGVLKNWLRLQSKHTCFFSVADLHALTTHHTSPRLIQKHIWDILIDWLSIGIDPEKATLFIQSRVPEHSELAILLGMNTPISWLERIPSYKEHLENLKINRNGITYGFLGYPVLMAADILLYRASLVPAGEDQAPHLEIAREISRRFNRLYGADPLFDEKAKQTAKKLDYQYLNAYLQLRVSYQQEGDIKALEKARKILVNSHNLSRKDFEILSSYLEGTHLSILSEPKILTTEISYMPGLDGRKMSKSYGNSIGLREDRKSIEKKILTMRTDPARKHKTDPGEPEKCPTWKFHKIYSSEDTKEQIRNGCRKASIGCIECKRPIIHQILLQQEPILNRAQSYLDDSKMLRAIIEDGCERARKTAKETICMVREAMSIDYV